MFDVTINSVSNVIHSRNLLSHYLLKCEVLRNKESFNYDVLYADGAPVLFSVHKDGKAVKDDDVFKHGSEKEEFLRKVINAVEVWEERTIARLHRKFSGSPRPRTDMTMFAESFFGEA